MAISSKGKAKMSKNHHQRNGMMNTMRITKMKMIMIDVLENKYNFFVYIFNLNYMGNQILGRRSRNFYRGFNKRQLSYLKQKF